MNTRTGQTYRMQENESLRDMVKRIDGEEPIEKRLKDFTMIKGEGVPNPNCKRCHGSGKERIGSKKNSRPGRFRPCRCSFKRDSDGSFVARNLEP